MFLLTVSLASAHCPSTPAGLHAAVETSVAAWRAWDWPLFDETVAELVVAVQCAEAVLAPAQAEELHLAFALAAARRRDLDEATRAFRAVLLIEPGWLLPEDLGVPGSLLAAAWAAAHGPTAPDAARLDAAGWFVDGVRARRLPLERAALLQRSGEPVATWYLPGGVVPEEVSRRRPRSGVAWGLAGAAALLSAGAFTAAGVAYGAYPDEPDHPERLEAVNHAGVIGGTALGVGALGLASVAVLVEW